MLGYAGDVAMTYYVDSRIVAAAGMSVFYCRR